MGEYERIVIGAGPAGCAVALRLAAAGQRPLLLERSRAVRPRLCGEFVSAEAAAALAALGVDVAALGGRETRHLRLAFGRQCIEAELPFTAFGLSRAALDAALQARVQAAGVPLWRGARASLREVATARRPHRLCVTLPDGTAAALHTRSLLLACGKTDLAPLQRRPRRAPESLVGLQWHLRLQPEQLHALHGHVEVLLFEHGYGGLQPVEDGRVNLCLLVPPGPPGVHLPGLLRALGGECPLLAQRLDGAQGLETAPRTIFRVPYGYLHPACAADPPGLWRLGDQAAVIPSFTGDGVAIALHSAAVAAEELLAGASPLHYHRRLQRELRGQMARATALYRIGRRQPTRALLIGLLQRWPTLAGWLAGMTRVPAGTLFAPCAAAPLPRKRRPR